MQRALPRNPGPSTSEADAANALGPMEATLSCLWVLTPVTATISLLVVVVGMFTNQWLHTEEKMDNPSYNGTGEKDYLSKFTTSGLWMLCFTNPGETLYDCDKIDFFSKEEYSPDPNDSTMAIPYTVTRSVIFFLSASLLLCSAYCCCLVGQCVRHRSLYTFISGVIFIVTGLVMLFGLIMYISVFKAEVGSKLRPRSQLQPPAFYYWYGYSFLLYVGGLVTTQITGISSIFLFIYKLQYQWQRKHLEELKRGKTRQESAPCAQMDHYYPCRRHPEAYLNSNSAMHLPPGYQLDKRYFFSKEPLQEASPCSVHRRQQPENSLKDVSSFYDFPPPPTISYQFDEHFNSPVVVREAGVAAGRHFPRDITANTVSTTADVNCEEFLGERLDDYSPSIQHEFVTFDLDQPLPLRGQAACKTFESDAMRRTTPV